jgi:hypothetical protein
MIEKFAKGVALNVSRCASVHDYEFSTVVHSERTDPFLCYS